MQHAVLDIAEEDAALYSSEDTPPDLRLAARRELLKQSLTFNVYAGTGSDKLLAKSNEGQPNNLTQVMIVLNCQRPEDVAQKVQEYVEGEVNDA